MPSDRLKAQTQRSLENFKIGGEKMPVAIVRSLAIVKYAKHGERTPVDPLGRDSPRRSARAAREVIEGRLDDRFPPSWTGSGTQTNMNLNER